MNLRSALLAITVGVLSMPVGLKAQHSRGGVPGSASYRTHGAGSVPAPRPAIPTRGTGPYGLRTDIPTPVGLNPPAASYTGILPGAFKSSGNGAGRYGRGGVGPFIGAPLYLPYLGYDPSLNTFPSYNQTVDPNAQAYGMAQDALGEQIRQLTAELDSMKRQLNTPPASYAPPPVPQAPAAMAPAPEDAVTTSQPSIAVVLKNGQRMSIQSYAIMNGFLWDFSKQPVRKIPVSNIDIPESTKATEANGTEFPDVSSASRVSVSH
jgi:hypothetical protein